MKNSITTRIYHPWWLWECYRNGFYNSKPPCNFTDEEATQYFKEYLSDLDLFNSGINRVFSEWTYSCEHFLTNLSLNRIAWLGQASVCLDLCIPSKYKIGFKLLSKNKQDEANALAKMRIIGWVNEKNNAIC